MNFRLVLFFLKYSCLQLEKDNNFKESENIQMSEYNHKDM